MKTKNRLSNKAKTIIIAVVVAIGVAAVAGILIGVLGKSSKSVSPGFSRGSLSADTGEFLESDTTLVTKNLIECRGLKVTLDFDNTSDYQIFWYNEDGLFLSCEGRTDDAFTGQVPDLARYCRIVIYPELAEDVEKISLFSINDYSKKLNITVDRDQTFAPEDLYETAKVNSTDDVSLVTDVTSKFTFISNATIGDISDYGAVELTDFNEALEGSKPDGFNVVKLNSTDVAKYIIRFNDVYDGKIYYVFFYEADGSAVKPAVRINAVAGTTEIITVPEAAAYACFVTFPDDTLEGGKDIPIVINEYLPR